MIGPKFLTVVNAGCSQKGTGQRCSINTKLGHGQLAINLALTAVSTPWYGHVLLGCTQRSGSRIFPQGRMPTSVKSAAAPVIHRWRSVLPRRRGQLPVVWTRAKYNKIKGLAEREGFEPPIPVKVCLLSRQVPSTTRPSLRKQSWHHFIRSVFPPKQLPFQRRPWRQSFFLSTT